MKVIKILFGVLFALYGVAQLLGVTIRLFLNRPENAYGMGQWFGGIAGIFIGAAISIALFRSAFRKQNS